MMSAGICPLCQQANACALAQPSSPQGAARQRHCWCFDKRLDKKQKQQLAKVDKQVCVCKTCLEKLKAHPAQTLAQ